MTIRTLGLAVTIVSGISAVLIGCGGSAGSSIAERSVGPPTALEMQSDFAPTALSPVPGLSTAIKGPVITAGIQNSAPFVSVGGHQFSLGNSLIDPQIAGVNANYMSGSTPGGSFIWPYRTSSAPINLPGEFITAQAKTSDRFLSLNQFSKPGRVELEVISYANNRLSRVPIPLPAIESASQTIVGIAVSDLGTALIQVVPIGTGTVPETFRHRSVHPSGTVAERAGKFLVEANGAKGYFYLVSPNSKPVALTLPVGTFAMQVTGLNNRGIAVGGAFTGDPRHPNVMPYYWDGRGTAYPMPVPPDVTLGFAQDINDQGLVVGGLGNDLTEFAAMWPTVSSNPVNVNALLSNSFPYDITYVSSIGSDFTMAAEGFSKFNMGKPQAIALQPQ